MKTCLIFFLFLLSTIYSHDIDSLVIDKLKSDTTSVIDTISVSDSLRAVSDSLKKESAKVLMPILPKGFLDSTNNSQLISRRDLIYNIYNYTGDYFYSFPLSFQRNLGILGQPHEVTIYGSGFNEISYLQNGFYLNDRITNSLDLNNFQSESIDSVEVISSPRGFLYGTFNNPVTVNFISRELFLPEAEKSPFSRMRYYQAPDEEAMIDAIYRTYLAKRIIGQFEITNKTIADRFQNSNYGSWKASAELKYLLSNNINLSGNYGYVKSETRLFGGLNLDSIQTLPSNSTLLEQDISKPVNYPNRYQKHSLHRFSLKLLNNYENGLFGNIDLYYCFSQVEFRQNEDSLPRMPVIFHNNKYNVYGGLFRQNFNHNIFNLDISANYEVTKYNADVLFSDRSIRSGNFSSKLSFKIIDIIQPSVYAKYLYYNSHSYAGYGADLTLNILKYFKLYGGISQFSQPYNVLEQEYSSNDTIQIFGLNVSGNSKKITSLELGADFLYRNIYSNFKFFHRNTENDLTPVILDGTSDVVDYIQHAEKITGFGLELKFNLWQIFLESNSAYYYSTLEGTKVNILPEYYLNGKLYFQDTLFNSNLFLKTGVSTNYIGTQDFYSYDFEKSISARFFYNAGNQLIYQKQGSLNPSLQLNFFLVGEIRRRAVIYFSFENLLNNEYYIVPFFPMKGFGYRLGFSWEFLN